MLYFATALAGHWDYANADSTEEEGVDYEVILDASPSTLIKLGPQYFILDTPFDSHYHHILKPRSAQEILETILRRLSLGHSIKPFSWKCPEETGIHTKPMNWVNAVSQTNPGLVERSLRRLREKAEGYGDSKTILGDTSE